MHPVPLSRPPADRPRTVASRAAAAPYAALAAAHLLAVRAAERLRSSAGQGTVEYVALILLVALVMAGVVAAMKGFKADNQELGTTIIDKIKSAVKEVKY